MNNDLNPVKEEPSTTRAAARQQAAMQKRLKAKGKSDQYVAYKQAKVECPKALIKCARLVKNLQSAGLM